MFKFNLSFFLMVVYGSGLCLCILGCGTSKLNVDFHSPTVRFQTPETTGKTLGVRGLAGYASSHKVSIARSRQTKDLINNNPSAVVMDTNSEYSVSSNPAYGVDVGILSRLDFVFSKATQAHYRFGGKFQFLGKPGATEVGLKAAVLGSYGYKKENDVNKTGIFDDPKDYTTVSGSTTMNSIDKVALVGYRFVPRAMIYLLAFSEENKTKSTISIQQQSDLKIEKTYTTEGLNLGAEIGGSEKAGVFLQLEGGLSRIRDKEGIKARHRTYGVSAGGRF